ncbi:MAG TPA: YebC/PmpR family DNA-binding transcriptional regulator [Anaerolineae bacterium]|nr:YebC/PmpR family DNA-binding transcriptional regulator [Anaerolineae bacterium]
MSGHSKWSTIKRKKGVQDAKRGQLFTQLAREITIAAREGGSDTSSNFRLRIAIDRARSENMPKDNIERAVKRGTGEDKSGAGIEQITYEGYAPHGIALLIESLTENRNRTVADLRHILTRSGGNMGEVGSVSWQFKRIAYFAITAEGVDFDKIFEYAVEGGADDISQDEEIIEIFAPVDALKKISNLLADAEIETTEAGVRMVPNQEMTLDTEQALKVMRVIEELEDLADVQNVYSNLKISEDALAVIEAA